MGGEGGSWADNEENDSGDGCRGIGISGGEFDSIDMMEVPCCSYVVAACLHLFLNSISL